MFLIVCLGTASVAVAQTLDETVDFLFRRPRIIVNTIFTHVDEEKIAISGSACLLVLKDKAPYERGDVMYNDETCVIDFSKLLPKTLNVITGKYGGVVATIDGDHAVHIFGERAKEWSNGVVETVDAYYNRLVIDYSYDSEQRVYDAFQYYFRTFCKGSSKAF
jgi:hypothetical protein